MEKKNHRPYLLLLIEYKGKKVVIPFRTYIKHKYCYPTLKAPTHKSGLDYTKALIVEESYINYSQMYVSPEEFAIVKRKINTIVHNFEKYVEKYKKSHNKIKENKAHREDLLLCDFSCLKYFHEELEIEEE